jgi:hypothetical protein
MIQLMEFNPRYFGSYTAMIYGLAMAISGYIRPNVTMASLGELVLYGAVLYHARKRQRFGSKRVWIALEAYTGLSVAWMAVNILRTQVWRWHPLAFGLMPLVVVGTYLVALIGKPSAGRKTDTVLSAGSTVQQVSLVITVAALWAILNFYAFPKFGFVT